MELTGRTLGKYLLREELGYGGMAIAYRGYDPNLERDVALLYCPVKMMAIGLPARGCSTIWLSKRFCNSA